MKYQRGLPERIKAKRVRFLPQRSKLTGKHKIPVDISVTDNKVVSFWVSIQGSKYITGGALYFPDGCADMKNAGLTVQHEKTNAYGKYRYEDGYWIIL